MLRRILQHGLEKIMSKKLDALLSTLNDVTVAVIHDNGPSGVNTVAFVNMPKVMSTSEKLEHAFMLTNSIDDAWYNNKEITKMFDGDGCRSTMVGDMVLIGTDKYKVEPMGWSKV
jgi:hypothetical protein